MVDEGLHFSEVLQRPFLTLFCLSHLWSECSVSTAGRSRLVIVGCFLKFVIDVQFRLGIGMCQI